MRVQIHIDFEISPRVKRALKIGIPAAVILAGGVVYANVPNTFKDGDALSAQTMNDNFTALDTRLAKVEAQSAKEVADGGFSIGATYCGATGNTPANLSQLAGGGTSYVKARAACQTACSQPSAHMCSGEELVRSAQLGLTTGNGWYSSGAQNSINSECIGWTDGTSTSYYGPLWTNQPNSDACNTSHPVLCCN
jgi:hypothetical protein